MKTKIYHCDEQELVKIKGEFKYLESKDVRIYSYRGVISGKDCPE
ncbi:hypothetical protein PBN151_1355 [Paenibacillus sp. NAIST15-1]|nr:hypothetical protein PBN151_1355 [Paenibacillus sp. NAIST15-1]